jgi:hypothetical protein
MHNISRMTLEDWNALLTPGHAVLVYGQIQHGLEKEKDCVHNTLTKLAMYGQYYDIDWKKKKKKD